MVEFPHLFSFRRCPYAIRTRLTLALCDIKVHITEVDLKDKPAEMIKLSAKATVPVMQLSDGTVFEESWDIMRWAVSQNDPAKLYQSSLMDKTEQLITDNDFGFKTHLDKYKYADRYPEFSMEHYRQNCFYWLEQLETLLKENQFLLSSKPSLADVALFPFIRQFAHVDKPWFDQTPYPLLQQWLKYWLDHPVFITVMKKASS